MNSVHLMTQEKYRVEPGKKTESECTKPQPGPAGPACAHRLRPGRPAGRAPRACRAPTCLPAARPARPAAPCRTLPAPRAPSARTSARLPACASTPCARPRPSARQPRAPAPSALQARLHPRLPTPAPAARPVRPSACCLLKWAVAYFRFCTKKKISFFFFHFFQPLESTKNIFIYFLSFSSTPINLLKFISSILLFFFFHSPTNQINCLNLFDLFSYSSTHCKLQGLFSNMPMCYLPKHTNIHITHTTCHTHQTNTYNHSSIHMITHKTHMPCPSFVPCLS